MNNILQRNKKGFTLIELMVAISIIALLAAIALSTISDTKKKAKDAKIKTEIHEIQVALEEYNTQHGGYPNGTSDSTPTSYCIGATDCMLAGAAIHAQLSGTDISLHKSTEMLASSFPVFNESTGIDDLNKGYIYITCGTGESVCANSEAKIIYPKITTNEIVFMKVGEFRETSCDSNGVCSVLSTNLLTNGSSCTYNTECQSNSCNNSICQGTVGNGGNCSASSDCNQGLTCVSGLCSTTGSNGYDCGPTNSTACTSYCANQQSLNYDADGTGGCTGTWFTTDGSTITLGYSYFETGWAGQGYYSSSSPTGRSYFDGTGDCVLINNISTSVQEALVGNYCSIQRVSGYSEQSYPWITSDTNVSYYGYTYSNGWSGYTFYGTSYPTNHSYYSGSGDCIYVSVSSTYGSGNQSGNYCTSPTVTTCTDSSACNYNSSGSCDYNSCKCTDSTACNYSPSGTGTCDYSCNTSTCTDINACNYNSSGSCDYSCKSCSTDASACNYSYSGTGSCDYSCKISGCTNSSACNYNASANTDDGSCEYTSCLCGDSSACNYQSKGACDYTCNSQCSTDTTACNYGPNGRGMCDYSCLSCKGSVFCGYNDSTNCSGSSGGRCTWTEGTAYSCTGSYNSSGDCNVFNYDYSSCSNTSGCYTNYDGDGNFYCSGTYSYSSSCSELGSASCGYYSGCSWSGSPGSCNPNVSCTSYADYYSCGNANGCLWSK